MKRALVVLAVAALVVAGALLYGGRRAAPAAERPGPSGERGFVAPEAAPQLATAGSPAVPPELAAAKREREAALGALRDSGKVTAKWTNDGNLLLETVAHDAHAAGWTQAGCFVAGCGGTLLFASDDAMTAGRAIAEALDGYRAWTGTKHWTAPERWLGGRVSITLVLGRPQTSDLGPRAGDR
ncbi:MAG TPA: hypothetical protein VGF94_27010 [Kofleriaceae bacterium]|jgi:hypothetical protein